MKEVERRDILKGIVGTAGVTATATNLDWGSVRERFQNLSEAVDERRTHRKNNPGGTVYLGSVNRADVVEPSGVVSTSPKSDLKAIDRLLEEGNSPEQIAKDRYDKLDYNDGSAFNYFQEGLLPIDLIHLNTDGTSRPLGRYETTLEESLNKILGIDVTVSSRSVVPDQEDVSHMENVSASGFEALDADLGLKQKYGKEERTPIFLSEKEIFSEGGHADYLTDVSWVELTWNEDWNESTITHEAGHATLFLPHTYSREGVMSYNHKSGNSTEFNQRSAMAAERIMKGNLEAEAEDTRVIGFKNGESYDTTVKKIDYRITPGKVDEKRNSEDAVNHIETVLEDMYDFETENWRINHHLDESNDVDIYIMRHEEGYVAEFEVDRFIEKMTLYEPDGREVRNI